MRYHAFISYSHAADADLALGVQRALEKFAKPAFKRRALNIFRDETNLSASPDLWGKIESALAASSYFIVFASPAAAESTWCRKEIDYWRANKPLDRILILVTGGTLLWDDAATDFDWDKTDCLPDSLSGAFNSEPLYVDFRERPRDLSLADPDFSSRIVLLAATLHERSVGDMAGEDARQHARTLRLRNGAIGLLSVLLLVAVGAAAIAYQQRQTALDQRDSALARSYLSAAKALLGADPTLSLQLARHAYQFAKARNYQLDDFEDQLLESFYNDSNFELETADTNRPAQPHWKQVKHSDTEFILDDADDRQVQVTIEKHHWDRGGQQELKYTFSPKAKFLVTNIRTHQSQGQYYDTVATHYPDDKKALCTAKSQTFLGSKKYYPPRVRFDANENIHLVAGQDTGVVLFLPDTEKGGCKTVLDATHAIIDAALSPNGGLFAASLSDGNVHVQTTSGGSHWFIRRPAIAPVDSLWFSEDGRYVFTQSGDVVQRWNSTDDKDRKYLPLARSLDNSNSERTLTVPLEGGEGSIVWNEREEKYEMAYVDIESGLEIANFGIFDRGGTEWKSGRFRATRTGIYNHRNALLIPIDATRNRGWLEIDALAFSTDGKYFFAQDRLVILDADLILERLSNEALFGELAALSEDERRQYLIE